MVVRDLLAVNAEQLVRRAVRRRLMRGHAEALLDRLEVLFLFVNAGLRAPPPRLMHERPVRRIHQPDDAVIDVARQIGGEMGRVKALAELGHLGNRREIRNVGGPFCHPE